MPRPLYRVVYIREGSPRGVTISAESPTAAERIAARLCHRWSDDGQFLSIMPFDPKRARKARSQRQMRLDI